MKALFCTLLIFFSGCICTHDYYAPRVRAVPPPQPAYYYNSYDYYAYPPPIVFFDGGHHGHKEKSSYKYEDKNTYYNFNGKNGSFSGSSSSGKSEWKGKHH